MRKENPARVIKDVGRRVAELRRARGWTQEELAVQLSVSVQYVRRVEGGGENLTIKSLVEIARVCGARTAELLSAPASRRVVKGRPRRSPAE